MKWKLRVLRETLGTKMDEVTGSGEKYIMRSSVVYYCSPHIITFIINI